MESKGKVLVVDDEEIILTFFCDLLGQRGYDIILARNGQEAIEKIKEEEFDVAFIDAIMPVIDGLEVLRMIKKIRPSAKSIMITAYAVEDLMKQAVQEGAYACIRKPFGIKEILEPLEKILFGPKEAKA